MADKTYRIAAVAVSLFSLILLVPTTANAVTTADVPNANSIVKDNIEYYMQTEKAVYDVRENVEMLYRVTNVGNEDVEFVFTYGPLDNTCDWIVDKDGIRIWDNLGRPGTAVMTHLVLSPSQSYAYTHTWDMTNNDGDDISPGNYTVTGVLGYYPPHERYVPVSVSIDIIHELETYVHPGESIQARIDDPNVIDGDTIIVYPGTYTGDGNRDIDFLGKAITVRSIAPNDPNIVSATIIDCDGTKEEPHRGFYFHNDEDENSILAGFTITNGYAYTGGAICCQACRPTITNCLITGNTGGGIHCGSICYLEDPGIPPIEPPPGPPIAPPILPAATGGEYPSQNLFSSYRTGPTITNCSFTENTGSGVLIGGSNATLVKCVFSSNSGSGVFLGGSNVTLLNCFFNENLPGAYIRDSNTTFVNCTFHDNFSWEKGGAIYSYDSNTSLTNCIFTDNSTNYWGGAIYSEYQSSLTLTGCTFIANSTGMGGGGICNIDDSSATLVNCTFNDNSADSGGGIYNKESSLKLTGCTFNNNFNPMGFEGGGGIYSECGKPTIKNCTFTGNSANGDGGAILLCRCYVPPILPLSSSSPPVPFSSLYEQSSWEVLSDSNAPGPLITNCIFTGNSGSWGGGLVTNEPNSTVVNCIFIENNASSGGGMYSSATNASLTECVFIKNSANYGGGLSSLGNLTSLNGCVFSNNSAKYLGGGIRNQGIEYVSNGYTVLANSSFTGNSANYGGGIYNNLVLDAIILNCAFTGNRATENGGAIYNLESTTWLINSNCSQNWAAIEGGGIWWFHLHPSSESPPGPQPPPIPALPPVLDGTISNSTIEGILATDDSDLDYIFDPMITNCIFWGNEDGTDQDMSAQIWVDLDDMPFFISYNCIEDWLASSSSPGNMNANPAFVQLGYWAEPNDPNITVDPNDPLAIWINGDYHLLPISPCIDAGDPDYIAEPNETDLDGEPRIINDLIDMGAYEHQGPRQTQRLYVDDDAVGTNNGSSWEYAFNYLQDALAISGRGDEIRVAQGIYKPDQGAGITPGDREATFPLTQGVIIMGSYAGIGAQDPNERNVELYETILSGDLNGDDLGDPYDPNRSENSYHVINTSRSDSNALLDGFTVIAGNANADFGGYSPHNKGGAVYNEGGSPKISNCKFIGNYGGGAIYNVFGSPKFINCIFEGNPSCAMYNLNCNLETINCMFIGNYGSGMFNENSDVTLTGCSFLGNYSSNGGGMFNDNSNVVLTDCSFFKNAAKNMYYGVGGGMYSRGSNLILINCAFEQNWVCVYHMAGVAWTADGGGMYNTSCDLTLFNCSFIGNAVGRCGGISDYDSSAMLNNSIFSAPISENHAFGVDNAISASTQTDWQWIEPTTRVSGGGIFIYNSVLSAWNCTFAGNLAWWGGGMANYDSSLTLTNCILWGDKSGEIRGAAVVTYSDIQGGRSGQGNIDVDPYFIEPGYWDANGTPEDANDDYWIDGDHHLLPDSPCIDAGDPNYIAEPNVTDLDGKPRISNGRIDMGAYEFDSKPIADAGEDQTAYAWIDGMAQLTLDGTGSFDGDGQPLTYLWSWTIDGSTYDVNDVSPTIKLPVDKHIIELIVNDGTNDSEPDQVIVTVVDAVESQLWVLPRIINRRSRQKYILASVRLPEGITKGQIDTDKPLLLYPGGVEAIHQYIFRSRKRGAQQTSILAFFDKAELMDAVPDNGRIELQVVGRLKTGQYFYGIDTVNIIGRSRMPRRSFRGLR